MARVAGASRALAPPAPPLHLLHRVNHELLHHLASHPTPMERPYRDCNLSVASAAPARSPPPAPASLGIPSSARELPRHGDAAGVARRRSMLHCRGAPCAAIAVVLVGVVVAIASAMVA